jgi:hypothetical protein
VKPFIAGFVDGVGSAVAFIAAWLRREFPQSGRYRSAAAPDGGAAVDDVLEPDGVGLPAVRQDVVP